MSFLFYTSSDPSVAVPLCLVSRLFLSSSLGPTVGLIQGLAPLRTRALWEAVTSLVINLIGRGLRPTAIGLISAVLRPTFGEDSLRYAMLTFAATTPLALWHY